MFNKSLVKGILSAFVIGTFCSSVPYITTSLNNTVTVYAATKKIAVCTVDKLKVRTDAGTEFAQLTSDGVNVYLLLDGKAEVKGDKKDKDGVKWYKVSFRFSGKNVTGFVRSDFVKLENKTTDTGDTKDTEGNTTTTTTKLKEVSKYVYKGEVKTKGLRVRTDAGTDKPQYKLDNAGVVLPNGQILNVTGEKNDAKKTFFFLVYP